jgi:hypothetical protein
MTVNKVAACHVALTMAVAAVAAGCGGSSSQRKPASAITPSTSASTTVPAPKGGFAGQLNTLCQHGNGAIKAATTVSAKIAVIQSYIPKFQALAPPAAEQATYAKFIAGLNAEVTAAKANNGAALRRANADVKAQGAKLGAPSCAGQT